MTIYFTKTCMTKVIAVRHKGQLLFCERKVSIHGRQKRAWPHGNRAIGSLRFGRQTSQLNGSTTDAELACD